MAGKKNEQVEITPPATLEEALKVISEQGDIIVSKDAEIDAKTDLIESLLTLKTSLELDLENTEKEFKEYKEEAEAALMSLGKEQVIVTDRPVLRYNGTLYKFKLVKFAIRGKGMVTAQQIIDNPDGYDIDELINKFQILKPYKV